MRFPELIYDRAIFKPCALNSGAWLVESLKSKVRMIQMVNISKSASLYA